MAAIPGLIAPVAGLLTVLWLPMLGMFNNRPGSHCPLAKAKAHFLTMVILTEAWFRLLTADTLVTCKPDPHHPFKDAWARCRMSSSASMSAFLICAISTPTAIYIAVKGSHLGLSANISSLGNRRGHIRLESQVDGRLVVVAYGTEAS
ncbi:hypothetical protein EIP91_008318 [Steccherinum ochraceum]|uniref:Uncharacterized protein n=1 Tax=Steccherinum ochraceum TaxID=92696 RepID=A0A4R0RSC2_9APHY|nr:hypothetical protein EIP91_008318 [Steccherinum ochraceum]